MSQAGTVSVNLTIGTSKAAEMLLVKVSSTLVLPNGALTMMNEANKPTISSIKGVGLNLVRSVSYLSQSAVPPRRFSLDIFIFFSYFSISFLTLPYVRNKFSFRYKNTSNGAMCSSI